jgi:DNA-binding IclR family transcriptional regulator
MPTDFGRTLTEREPILDQPAARCQPLPTDKEVGMAGGALESGRSVASRVSAILMAFRGGGTHSLTELAGIAGLPISTTHRLVGELVSRRVLERTERGGYRIGLPLRMIGGLSFPSAPPLLERALDVVNDLASVTGTSVRVGVLDPRKLIVTATEPGRAATDGFVEDTTPPYASALGRVLLAFSPSEVVDEVLAAARTATGDRDPISPDRLRRVLATTRLTRVAVHRDGLGRCELAVPVFGTGGTLLAALEASIPDPKSGFEQVRGALLIAASSLSRQLATSAPVASPVAGSAETDATG